MEITKWMDGLFLLDDGRVRQFLFLDQESALLIDTGFPDSGVYNAVQKITDRPVTVLMTHGDWDHTGGLPAFGKCYLHERDWHLVPAGVELHHLKEGDVFSCGDVRLEVVEIPGHTFGSVAFWDRAKKLLLPGDSVQQGGPIYMFGDHRDLDLYIESQKKLWALRDGIETILPCHHAYPVDVSYIEKNLQDAIALKNGTMPGHPHPTLPCASYQGQYTEFYY